MNANPSWFPPVARNLRYLQAESGETWQALARALEVGERLVTGWKQDGGTIPSWPNICKLAEHYHITDPGWFYLDHPHTREEAREGEATAA